MPNRSCKNQLDPDYQEYFHYLTGANSNQYNYSSGGASFASQNAVGALKGAGATAANPIPLTGSLWQKTHQMLSPRGNGVVYRKKAT